MNADYIAAVEETLSDLTGERGLGAKIASDVADCLKLDLLQELRYVVRLENVEADVARTIEIMARNVWNDIRIAVAGLEKLRKIHAWMGADGGPSLGLQLMEMHTAGGSGGLQILLQNM